MAAVNAAAVARTALCQLPELKEASQYPTWRESVLSQVQGLNDDPLIAPGMMATFNARILPPGAAPYPPYLVAQQTCLHLMNASAAKAITGTARAAIGNRTALDEIVRHLDAKRGWGPGDAATQEDRSHRMYNIRYTPGRAPCGTVDDLCNHIEAETRACGPRFPNLPAQEQQQKRVLLQSLTDMADASAVVIANRHENIGYDAVKRSVEDWWLDKQRSDAAKQSPVDKLFAISTAAAALADPSTTSSPSTTLPIITQSTEDTIREQMLIARVTELEADRNRLRDEQRVREEEQQKTQDKTDLKELVMAAVAQVTGESTTSTDKTNKGPKNQRGRGGGGGGGGGGAGGGKNNQHNKQQTNMLKEIQQTLQAFQPVSFGVPMNHAPPAAAAPPPPPVHINMAGPMAPGPQHGYYPPNNHLNNPYGAHQNPNNMTLGGNPPQGDYGPVPRNGGCHNCGGGHFASRCPWPRQPRNGRGG